MPQQRGSLPDSVPLPAPAADAFDYDALALAEQSAGIGVWSIDLTTGRVRATAQFFRIMGLPPTSDQVPVEALRALRHPHDRQRVIDGFQRVLEGHSDSYEIEYRIIRPDGELRWIFGRGRIVRDASGRPVRYSGVDLDITDRKKAEAELAAAKEELEKMNLVLEERVRERTAQLEAEGLRRVEAEARLHQAQKMEAVGQLTGGIAHDFNNILQVIVGNLEIARIAVERSADEQKRQDARVMILKAIDTMKRASQSAKQLVQRLLAFGRRQTLQPIEMDINAMIVDMTDMVRRALGETIRVNSELTADLWLTFADRNQLESALLNLVLNARDAMPHGGELTVATSNVTITAGEIEDMHAGEYVQLCVIDTGCGIPADHLDKVFEPFFTTKDTGRGSGLGLSMIYGYVKQSNGHVKIDSRVGAGTTVSLYLPRHVPAIRPLPVAAARVGGVEGPLPKARPGESIMVVEDNDDVRRLAVDALESLGYRVIAAPDGTAALTAFAAPDAGRLDLLFTDVILPNGMSGSELADRISAERPGLPVLFASGYTRSVMPRDRRLSGAFLLQKPYSIDMLAVRCREAIDRK